MSSLGNGKLDPYSPIDPLPANQGNLVLVPTEFPANEGNSGSYSPIDLMTTATTHCFSTVSNHLYTVI
jgi:hypothetical protein